MPRGGELAARIRAAHAWSDLSRAELADAINVSQRTLGRLESGTASADAELRAQIADACGVPRDFLEHGFAPMTDPVSDTDQRIHAVEAQVAQMAQQLKPERLIETFGQLLAGGDPGGSQGRSATPKTRRAAGRHRAAAEGGDA